MLANFIHILQNIITPVFIIIGIGVILQRKFDFNLNTLAKLNLYYFVPTIIFVKLYEADFTWSLFLWVAIFSLSFIAVILLIGWGIAYLLPLSREERTVFSNSVAFYNSGNYGVPVNSLVFKQDPFAMSIQIITLLFQNVLTFTYGIFLMRSVQVSKLQALLGYFKMPMVYAIILAIILNAFDWQLPEFAYISVKYISDGFISIALVTLGAQVARLSFKVLELRVWLSVILRLVICPLIGLGLIYLFNIDGIMAQALLISTAMPTSINSAIIAQEYNNEPEMAARIVLLSTLVSAITVTIVISLAWMLW